MKVSLSTGNRKLHATIVTGNKDYRVLGFGIPADHNFTHGGTANNTCPGASACRGICYAKQGHYIMGQVVKAKHNNLMASLDSGFVDHMVSLLKRRRTYNVVRIHDSGDFYSQEYYDKWCAIAKKLEGSVIFYAYTKALNLDLYSNKPNNLKIVQSLGGLYDKLVDMSRPHSRIFSTDEARISAGYVDGNSNDLPAILGDIKIGLVYHGVRNLTLPQVKYFS